MRIELSAVFLVLATFLPALNGHAMEDDPKACNCETVEVSAQEQAGGCPADVKEKTCPLYREARVWKERLRQQQEQRRLEKRMEPPTIPR